MPDQDATQIWAQREVEKGRLTRYRERRRHVYANHGNQADDYAQELDHLIELTQLIIDDLSNRLCDLSAKTHGVV